MPFSFRCNNCGRLHESHHAGIRALPTSCDICGAGVTFDEKGNKTHKRDNWEILSEAKPERLAELGLKPEDVTPHIRVSEEDDIKNDLVRIDTIHTAITAKEEAWSKNMVQHIDDWKKLDAELVNIDNLLPKTKDPSDHEALVNQRSKVVQAMKEIENKEHTDRDTAHKHHILAKKAEHTARVGKGMKAKTFVREPQNINVHASESVGSGNFGTKK